MTFIVVGNIESYIDGKLPPELNNKINETLRYHPNGYQRTWYYKTKRWDGWNYLYNLATQRFRSGLLWRVCKVLDRYNYQYKVVDERIQAETINFNINWNNITPYPFQDKASKTSLSVSHGILASPTGTGKTVIMLRTVEMNSMRSLIVVNSRVLLDQTFEFFDMAMPGNVGVVGSGDFELKDVTIATIQSLRTILGLGDKQKPTSRAPELKDWLDHVGLIIHDEVHEADSKGIERFYKEVPAYRFIGTTATPYSWAYASEKGKNLEMEQHFGIKVYDSRDEVDFIDLGLTVPLYINRFAAPVVDAYSNYDKSKKTEETYNDILTNQIVENDERIERLASKAREMYNSGLSCYIYYNRIAYGEKLCDAMHDLDPVMLQGNTPRKKRNQVFKDINSKDILIAVSDIGSYGLNIKSLDSIMIAFPTKDARQLKGRVCRADGIKKSGLVIDPVDVCPFLERHAEMRYNQYMKDGDFVVGY